MQHAEVSFAKTQTVDCHEEKNRTFKIKYVNTLNLTFMLLFANTQV